MLPTKKAAYISLSVIPLRFIKHLKLRKKLKKLESMIVVYQFWYDYYDIQSDIKVQYHQLSLISQLLIPHIIWPISANIQTLYFHFTKHNFHEMSFHFFTHSQTC